jgi:hypothetical protein
MAVEVDCFFQQSAQAGVLFFLGLFFGRGRLEHHPGLLGQVLEGRGEVPTFFFHDELEDVPTLVALAEAAPGAGIGEDNEGRGARVGVEGAETGIVLAGAPQLHRLGDQLDDVESGFYFIGYRHCLRFYSHPEHPMVERNPKLLYHKNKMDAKFMLEGGNRKFPRIGTNYAK